MAEERYRAFLQSQQREEIQQSDTHGPEMCGACDDQEDDMGSLQDFLESESGASQDYPSDDLAQALRLVGSYAGPKDSEQDQMDVSTRQCKGSCGAGGQSSSIPYTTRNKSFSD